MHSLLKYSTDTCHSTYNILKKNAQEYTTTFVGMSTLLGLTIGVNLPEIRLIALVSAMNVTISNKIYEHTNSTLEKRELIEVVYYAFVSTTFFCLSSPIYTVLAYTHLSLVTDYLLQEIFHKPSFRDTPATLLRKNPNIGFQIQIPFQLDPQEKKQYIQSSTIMLARNVFFISVFGFSVATCMALIIQSIIDRINPQLILKSKNSSGTEIQPKKFRMEGFTSPLVLSSNPMLHTLGVLGTSFLITSITNSIFSYVLGSKISTKPSKTTI